ncbi:hypothetical protein FN846DRAFT_446353 [Sphaerosporella brunnea]|uniref:Uncharacterized protein n=1 Tax=Sphaerosporella brunnea TaxID=1250544 RepID=A0A5J5EG98_9PEZI|nr:hypothetical protein FN846DRAFT_446353 [Sphaerosporella brunnea]
MLLRLGAHSLPTRPPVAERLILRLGAHSLPTRPPVAEPSSGDQCCNWGALHRLQPHLLAPEEKKRFDADKMAQLIDAAATGGPLVTHQAPSRRTSLRRSILRLGAHSLPTRPPVAEPSSGDQCCNWGALRRLQPRGEEAFRRRQAKQDGSADQCCGWGPPPTPAAFSRPRREEAFRRRQAKQGGSADRCCCDWGPIHYLLGPQSQNDQYCDWGPTRYPPGPQSQNPAQAINVATGGPSTDSSRIFSPPRRRSVSTPTRWLS